MVVEIHQDIMYGVQIITWGYDYNFPAFPVGAFGLCRGDLKAIS